MYKPTSPQDYLAQAPDYYRTGLTAMREVLTSYDLDEKIKWVMPVYGYGKKSVATLYYAKAYLGVWFTHGALLSDPNGILVSASPGKTIAQRQLRFSSQEEVDLELLRDFLLEAMQNQKDGLEFKPVAKGKIIVPTELQVELDADADLATAFAAFPPYKQREFCNSIDQVKRADTIARKVVKAVEMIRAGVGYSDVWRKKK